jgi:N-acetylneuraminic acid mutarotase
VIGGFIPGEELTSKESDQVYALRGEAWKRLPPLNHPRGAAAAAVVGDKIVVVGGQADGKLVPQTEVFDGEGWTDVAEIPTPREHLGAASDGRYLYAVGGRQLSAGENSGGFERYDPEANRWTKLDAMPETVGAVAATFAGGRVVAVGGESETEASDQVQGYDINGGTWSQLPPMSSPRHGASLAVVKDALYAIGGATEAGHVGATRQSEVLDLSGKESAPVAARAEWRAVTNAPANIQYAASAEVGGRIWLFGGLGDDEKATAETAAYDRAINTWTPGPRLPQPVHHAAAVSYRSEAVVIGGFLESGESDRVYALRGDRWMQLPPLNRARAAAAAAVVGNKIVVVGGQADGRLVPQAEVFDGQGWTEAADIPTPREHLGAASDGRYLYAAGGRARSSASNTAAFERYDPESDSWTELDPMPKVVGALGSAFLAGRVLAVGGERTNTVLDAVQAYDVRRQGWTQLPPLPKPRHGLSVAALRGSLYAIGGAAAPGHVQSTKDAYVLDLE